ncbi:MAG TPA: energy-coupling factor ABC transporter permease [Phycisphaerae bacterium]|nr:energy-coupling factor ABC transporter permease [Phycisphaerae bacterium]
MLAMHMANELLTPGVAGAFIVLSAGGLAMASRLARKDSDPFRVPLMGVLGAFVFAAQMINFPILPGTSGHLGGGVLLAILLGPHAATLVMAAILIVQCLIFQDGGLLALGTNILNLGIVPCYLGSALFHLLAGARPATARLYAAVFAATLVGMVAGAALVPVEVWLSGRITVPLREFLVVMVGLHLLIGLGEAIITFLVVGYVCRVRPTLLGPVAERLHASGRGLSLTAVAASFGVIAVLLAGVVSLYASSSPDALESITAAEGSDAPARIAGEADPTIERVTALQHRTAPLPDYQVPGWSETAGTSVSGLIGTAVTLALVLLIGRAVRRPVHEHAHPHPH